MRGWQGLRINSGDMLLHTAEWLVLHLLMLSSVAFMEIALTAVPQAVLVSFSGTQVPIQPIFHRVVQMHSDPHLIGCDHDSASDNCNRSKN